jgi:ubiquitin-like protein Nedd8
MDNFVAKLQVSSLIRVWVKTSSGKYILCPVFQSDTVQDLGRTIEARDPSATPKNRIFVFGNQELNPEQVLSKCGVVNDSELELLEWGALATSFTQRVVIVTPQQRSLYGVQSNETIAAFLARWNEGGRPEAKSMSFGGQPLPGHRTFGDCGVVDGSLLFVDFSPLQAGNDSITFKIKTLTGKVLAVTMSPTERVNDLKDAIQEMEGIPPDQQRIIFEGRQCEENESIGSCGITSGVTVHLVLRLKG